MRKLIERLNEWANRQDERLYYALAGLSQRTKVAIVLSSFSLFAFCALFSIGTACYRIGCERGIEIKHIKQLDLPQKQDSIYLFNHYDHGTEQKSHDQHERDEA